jgi:hypothetical protein
MTCRGSAISARTPRSPGQRKAPPSNWTGPVVQIRALDGRIQRRRDERVAVNHHRHNREWTRVVAARVSEMPEPPHLVQWHRRPRYTMNRATGQRSGLGAEPKVSVAAIAGSHGRCLLRRYGGVARRQSGILRRTHDRAPRLPPPWAPPCADRDLGQGTGERWGGSTCCERTPVVWLRRWPPPPPVGDDDSGLTGLGFGGARRRRLRRLRVA